MTRRIEQFSFIGVLAFGFIAATAAHDDKDSKPTDHYVSGKTEEMYPLPVLRYEPLPLESLQFQREVAVEKFLTLGQVGIGPEATRDDAGPRSEMILERTSRIFKHLLSSLIQPESKIVFFLDKEAIYRSDLLDQQMSF